MTENKKFRVIEEGVMTIGEMDQLLGGYSGSCGTNGWYGFSNCTIIDGYNKPCLRHFTCIEVNGQSYQEGK